MQEDKENVIQEEQLLLNALHLKLANALGVKTILMDKFKKNLTENEENRKNCNQIISSKNTMEYFFVLQSSPDTCQVKFEIENPQMIKKKAFFFLKLFPGPITTKNIQSLVFFETSKDPLKVLHALLSEIYLPILNNPDNQKGWNELLQKDLMNRINDFVAQIYLVIGKIQGKTLLPLHLEKTNSRDVSDKHKCQLYENRIITWTKQIKKVLDQEPEHILKENPNPDPYTELNFWKRKAENLNSIHEQLQQNEIVQILEFLEINKSTFINQFRRLQDEIREARKEANENFMYLSTLEEYFETLLNSGSEFKELPDIFLPIMHSIMLIFSNSNYYKSPSRIVLLIREICNAIIIRATEYIPGETIIGSIQNKDEIEGICDKLQITIDVCTKFKDTYFMYKAKTKGKWKFPPTALFVSLDNFLERCYDILHVTSTIQQFNFLENCYLGGTKGKQLTENLNIIYNEFMINTKVFQGLSYDVMNIGEKKFEADFFLFRNKMKELEKRVASIIAQSFDDLDTLHDRFKLLDSFEILLRRPLIQDELERKHIVLLESYKEDLKKVHSIFFDNKTLIDKGDERAPVFLNLPPIAAALTWTKSLEDRIKEPFLKLQNLDSDITEKEEYKDILKMYENLSKVLKEYKENKILSWQKEIQETSQEKLQYTLLQRDARLNTLIVNFDPALKRLLREVKYFYQLNINIPDEAAQIYANDSKYRTQINKMEQIVQMYNHIVTSLNPVEEPLIMKSIKKMDEILEQGISQLQWKSAEVNDFISKAIVIVEDVYKVVNKMKEDLEKIREQLKEFDISLVTRKTKSVTPEEFFTAHQASVTQSHKNIKNIGTAIFKLIKETNDSVKIEKKSKAWLEYQEFINDIVIESISKAILTSMNALGNLVDVQKKRDANYYPWFEISVQLSERKIQLQPKFDHSEEFNIKMVINTLVKDFIEIAINVQRVDTGGVGDYLVEMKDNFDVRLAMANIYGHVETVGFKCNEFIENFSEFNFYITNDPAKYFEEFLKDGNNKILKQQSTSGNIHDDEQQDEDVEEKNPLLKEVLTKIPPFEKFDTKIAELKEIKGKITHIKSEVEIHWLRIRADPLKKALESNLNEWILVFVNFLNNQVKNFIRNCQAFKKYLVEGIGANPQEQPENKQLLMNVMEVLSNHRLVNSQLEKNILFVREMINLLKKHSDFKSQKNKDEDNDSKIEDYLSTVDEIEAGFGEIFQQVITVKTNILELQQKETESLKHRVQSFSSHIVEFRNEFREKAPFGLSLKDNSETVKQAYVVIEQYKDLIENQKQEAIKFRDLENLFELEKTKYKELNDCSQDVRKLMKLWNIAEKIIESYEKWDKILWKNIKIDELSSENEKYIQILRQTPRDIKGLKGYQILVERVQNMKKSINCIDMLSSEAMQPRHWETISLEIGHQINEKASNFSFKDLIQVDIFKHEMIVQETTENANKELKIGKDLEKIKNTWAKLNFEFELFDQAGGALQIFKGFDTIQEILDNDTSKVLGLLSQGKSVEVFREALNKQKQQLNAVDNTLTIWGKVQKNWKRLVNIFLLSEDIRNSLQEATKTFDDKNNQFREIMMGVYENPKIIDACLEERKLELEEIHKSIEECEKKLNLYLEEKKKAFARFYFVSNQTLIDILSNGKNINKIASQYLGDLFDGVKELTMKPVKGSDIDGGVGMVAKEGEKVLFKTPFVLKEEIENWLRHLEHKIRLELQLILSEAKQTADEYFASSEYKENQKMDWINQFPAQISLLTVQTLWTDDVHKSFDDMEGGMSNAMKDCFEGIKKRIKLLIEKVIDPEVTGEVRNKIITIITIDVHSRDVVENLLRKNINDKESFQWYSQLKFYYSKEAADVLQNQLPRFEWEKNEAQAKSIIRIIDWAKFYSYEYVGNAMRLVITPLTDRCYITLTQALSLNMGGAPAGPAGTGKTETTKDLGRACGLPVFVFNCSEQMNTDSLGQIFMGLSQTGAWGCFDEFNRITIEVLSVVSTQVKQVLDALNEKRERFVFMEEEISLMDTVGFFITMNPGYAGRTELPENLKALFRSCAMVVPDLMLICENMLLSEGYEKARELAKKFVTLYDLSKTLLSKQKHYDWGLRAVKSVLRQAGKLKRQNKGKDENLLLFGALKDFNMPKIVTDDKPIFINLLKDLFTEVEKVPEVIIDEKLKRLVIETSLELKYQAEDQFVLKIIQLSEILEVRHCVFIIGPAGCGKSSVWKTLAQVFRKQGQETEYDCLDPKAVSSDELFGTLTKSKEFKNGVLSSIIKNQCKDLGKYKPHQKNKWSILDGDIDPEWIESLNTVMDDNKVLTLVSNDRFPLTPAMRLFFEISNLKQATPATVSRAGVLYINDTDIGWKPYFERWLDSHSEEQLQLKIEQGFQVNKIAFNELAKSVFLKCQMYFENVDIMKLIHIVTVVDIMMVETTCTIIDGFLYQNREQLKNKKEEDLKLIYEGVFLYAAMWGIGGTFLESGEDEQFYREFQRLWKTQSKIKYPEVKLPNGKFYSIFDFVFDINTMNWIQCEIPEFKMDEDLQFTNLFVPTMYTQRLWSLTELHCQQNKPIMYVGNAGTGKTALMNQFINQLSNDRFLKNTVNFSSLTTSASLQENIMGSGLSKLGMRLWGLGSGRTLVFFIDDINMPYVDKYGTQSPIALIRQILDYQIVYDRDCLEEYNKLQDIYFCAGLNPKAGSFNIEIRLQRHFSVFCLPVPNDMIISQIYTSILTGHFNNFGESFQEMPKRLVESTIKLYESLIRDTSFNPSAKKFHYQFNLRELSKVTEGVMMADAHNYKNNINRIAKLWVHECRRVFGDRLVFDEDMKKFDEYLGKSFVSMTENFIKIDEEEHKAIMGDENIFTTFISAINGETDQLYLQIDSFEHLKKILTDKLEEYNDTKAQMNLVLFKNAMMHITRISRIMDRSNGHALLVGVGGSGKQSLTKMSSFLQGYDLETLNSGSMSMMDFKQFLGDMIKKATKPPGTNRIFMITDTQIETDEMLIYINDMLNNGFIPGLWPREELDGHLQTLKNEARQQGITDTPENIFKYFVEKIKKKIHIVLCMSPVGDGLRIRSRKFPGIINGTNINWFHSWPKDALYDVAFSFLKDIEFPQPDLIKKLADNMAETHHNIDETNKLFALQERRYNYTTPTSFLELIAFYKNKLHKGRQEIDNQIDNLTKGLRTLSETQGKVKDIEQDLKEVMVKVEKKNQETQKLIDRVTEQKKDASIQQEKADEEEKVTMQLAKEANEVKQRAEEAYLQAKPKLENAQQALSRISEQKITIMKNLKQPPAMVMLTGKVLAFIFKGEKVDLFSDKDNEAAWKKAVQIMNNVKRFLADLKQFSAETAKTLDPNIKDKMKKLIESGKFEINDVMETSQAAGNLADWAHNIIAFNEAFNIVEPLEEQKNKAEALLTQKNKEMDVVKEKVRALNQKVANLEAQLAAAQEEQRQVEEEKKGYQDKLERADKLVKGLASENQRWTENVKMLTQQKLTVIGNSLLAAEFVSYIGPFTYNFREKLVNEIWLPNIKLKEIPIIEGITPLEILTNGASIAKWKNQGLPEDIMSLQNASIITSCSRWPLIIDPQLQGTTWLKGFYQDLVDQEGQKQGSQEKIGEDEEEVPNKNELLQFTLNDKKSWQKLKMAISYGKKVLLESVTESIDSSLENLLSRSIIKKSTTYYVKIGSDEIEYSPEFKLYLQCKRGNPHFRPETSAQCTIINFIVTEKGLEDQLLAMVVNYERQELEQRKQNLVRQQNDFEVTLSNLEVSLLESLSKANPETILEDTVLINNLDEMKKTATQIKIQKEEAKVTEAKINIEREKYRVLAAEGSMLYFLIITLQFVDHMYQYSLESFITFFFKAIECTDVHDESRVDQLVLSIRVIVYQWISRGLFERHKIIFLTMLTFRLLQKNIIKTDWNQKMMNYLMTCVPKTERENNLKDWLPNLSWFSVMRLAEIEEFEKLPDSIEKDLPARFKDWFNELNPENVKLPSEWRKLESQPFQKLCIIRALRPDRMTAALTNFITKIFPQGEKFVSMDQNLSIVEILESMIQDATRENQMNTPIFFILSPGADPVKDVEKIGKKMRFEYNLNNFFNIPLGQGQDIVADAKLEAGFKEGYWVMLQNIHLMPSWLDKLDKKLEQFAKEDGCHPNFRLFLTAEPSKNIPVGILERCIKMTNEPPVGLKANMKRAWTYFNKDEIDDKDTKYNHILFALCYFHSVLIERRKFGPKGWNMFYPFNIGDLRDSYLVLCKNAESNSSGKIPWDDLKYIFGEIMYGGHIVDDWDRRLCGAFLEYLLLPQLCQEDFELYPYVDSKKYSFKVPPANSKFTRYLEQIENEIKMETPIAYGLHPNAEIDLGTTQCTYIFDRLRELMPKEKEQQVVQQGNKGNAEHYFNKIFFDYNLKERIFVIADIKERIVDIGPFQNVFLQECEYMNALIIEITRSMYELDQGIKGILTITENMEGLLDALNLEKIPENWMKLAYPTKRFLSSFLDNLMRRIDQLSTWKDDPQNIPKVTFINQLFNPQSFFTAIKQYSKKGDLNKLMIQTEFTKKSVEEIDGPIPKDGAYCYGFLLEGAKWDWQSGQIEEARPKEMFSVMPVCLCRAILIPKKGALDNNQYECPVYRTESRGNTFITTAQLKTSSKNPPRKWILGGVAIILDVEGISDEFKSQEKK